MQLGIGCFLKTRMTRSSNRTLAKLLTPDSLREMADNRSFGRGRDYFVEGLVRSLQVRDGVLTAKVHGTRPYRVKLWEDDGELDYECNCPVGGGGAFCKHCVAAGLAWSAADQKGTDPELAAGSTNSITGQDIRKHLMGLEKKALVEMLLEQAGEEEPFYRHLLTLTARSGKKGLDLSYWKEALDGALWTDHFITYREAYDHVTDIEEVVDSIEKLLTEGHDEAVIELAEYGLTEVEKGSANMDDSDGSMGGLLERLQEIHLQACKKAKPNPVALAKRIFAYEMQAELDTFYRAAETYAEVFGESGLATYRKLAEAAWAKVPKLAPGDNEDERYRSRFRITSIMESLAKASGDIEELVAIKARDLTVPYSYLKIAEIYQEAGQSERALEWAEKGWKAFAGERHRDGRLREFITMAYHRLGRHDEAMTMTWEAFAARPTQAMYETLKSHADQTNQWSEWREKALAHIRKEMAPKKENRSDQRPWENAHGEGRSLLVDIFLWEKNPDAAWQEACAGGCSQRLWLTLAGKREKKSPQDAIDIYKPHIAGLLKRASKTNYPVAVSYMEKIRKLLTRLDRTAEFSAFVTEIRTLHKRKRNLMALLDQKRW